MTPSEQFARSNRFNGQHTVLVTDCGDGMFGVHEWGGSGQFLGFTDHLHLGDLIRARPEYSYSPKPRAPTLVAGINPDDLEIDL